MFIPRSERFLWSRIVCFIISMIRLHMMHCVSTLQKLQYCCFPPFPPSHRNKMAEAVMVTIFVNTLQQTTVSSIYDELEINTLIHRNPKAATSTVAFVNINDLLTDWGSIVRATCLFSMLLPPSSAKIEYKVFPPS